MREISLTQLGLFFLLLLAILSLGGGGAYLAVKQLPLGANRGVVGAVLCLGLVYLLGIVVHRVVLRFLPLVEGGKREGSREEFAYQIYVLFYLFFFFPFILSNLLPIPLMRAVYKALGCKIGKGSYGSSQLVDPPLIEIGKYCVLGQAAIISGHYMAAGKIFHKKVSIGNGVTIGAGAKINAGVTIKDGAVIGTGAVINPYCTIGEDATVAPLSYLKARSRVGPGEYWMGVPATRQEQLEKQPKP